MKGVCERERDGDNKKEKGVGCVFVCKRERWRKLERERCEGGVGVCVCERERDGDNKKEKGVGCVRLCVCERERGRERDGAN